MQHPLPIDTDSLNSAHSARLLAYYEAFCSPDEERHLWLAAHAAFPADAPLAPGGVDLGVPRPALAGSQGQQESENK